MTFINALVEGQTEETFIQNVINPEFNNKGIHLIPKIIVTKKVKDGKDFKGGISKYSQIKKDVQRLLHDTSVKAVTTMFDYYRIPKDFPGKENMAGKDCFEKIEYLEEKFNDNINHPRFLPFLVLHEFETFLFSSPKHVDEAFPELEIENNVNSIKNEFNTIEEIDEGHVTHPSARIINLIPSYQKRIDGPLITKRIGLEAIRKECRHFDNWLIKIEEIANN